MVSSHPPAVFSCCPPLFSHLSEHAVVLCCAVRGMLLCRAELRFLLAVLCSEESFSLTGGGALAIPGSSEMPSHHFQRFHQPPKPINTTTQANKQANPPPGSGNQNTTPPPPPQPPPNARLLLPAPAVPPTGTNHHSTPSTHERDINAGAPCRAVSERVW